MNPRLPQRVGQYAAAAELTARQPWEWQREAQGILAGLVVPLKPPPGLEAYVSTERAAAALSVRQAAARLLRDACRAAQIQNRKVGNASEARFYAPVRPAAIYAQVDHTVGEWLALGPKRTLRQALCDASSLLPSGELWTEGRGWRSLGAAPGQRRGGSGPQPVKAAPKTGAGHGGWA